MEVNDTCVKIKKMVKKVVIWICVLILLVSFVSAQKVCCLLPIANGCVYGQSSETGTIEITKEICEAIGGTVIGNTKEICNTAPCKRDCCCYEQSRNSIGVNTTKEICENKYEGIFHENKEKENCQNLCDTITCGNDLCEGDEITTCPQDCPEQAVIPPLGEEAVGCELGCPEKCMNNRRYSGECVNNECVYTEEENCESKKCIGPYEDGITKCIEKIDCEACNEPLGLYGIIRRATYEGVLKSCSEILYCYFDYTNTVVDAYFGCDIIDSCYDYTSSEACLESKCMPGQCKWEPTIDEFGYGICMSIEVTCEDCETELGDNCNSQTICRTFGAECNYNPDDGTCNEENPLPKISEEICDGKSNDGDTEIDEGFTDDNCKYVCESNGFTWTDLTTDVNSKAGVYACCGDDANENNPYESTETTLDDNNDNDCDGSYDEGGSCDEGTTKKCGTSKGTCQEGTQTCTNDIWSECEGAIWPAMEKCDNLDNDCDNEIDEGCVVLKIILKEPNDGFATELPYKVTIETSDKVECRYSENDLSFGDMSLLFTTENNLIHETEEFDKTEKWTIYISCKDEMNNFYKESFEIGYDPDKPVIDSVSAIPNPIIDVDCISKKLQTTLTIITNKRTICGYSFEEKEFKDMEKLSDVYDTSHSKIITGFQENKEYTINIKCKGKNWLISENKQITITVDLTIPLKIIKSWPKEYASGSVTLGVETNKCADCTFYKGNEIIGKTSYTKIHTKEVTLTDGEYTYYVNCTKQDEQVLEYPITFIVDTSAPEKPDVKAESYCSKKDGVDCKIMATWTSKDDESGINGYYYYVLNTTTDEVLFKEFTDEEESEELGYDDLNLENKFADGDKFEFLVSAQNNAGLWSENGTDTATVDYSKIVADKRPPTVRVYFNEDGDLVLECEDKETECVSLKYYLSSNGCPDESLYDDYIDPITITSEFITTVCWIAEDSSGNIEKDSILISKIKPPDEKEKDTDNDGMPDYWEIEHGLDPNDPNDALMDNDGDGLTNLEEYRYGTDPNKADTDGDGFNDKEEIEAGTDPLDKYDYPIITVGDSDGDGIPDSWEDKYDCIDKAIKDADKDYDNDGLTNREEYRYGTDPCDPDTDKDGYIDSVEIEKATNPLDENDYPKSRLWLWILIIILILSGLGVAGYFGYNEYKKIIEKKPKPKVIPKPIRRIPILERRKEREFKKREEEKRERRKKLFEAFTPVRKEEKIEKIKPKKHEIDIFERLPKIVQEDVFKKLPGEEDVFKKLPKAGKEVFKKLPIPKVKKKREKRKKVRKKGKVKRRRKGKKKGKKGQIAGQVIIYILAILIFGLIVIFGYREISNLMEKQQKVDLINFENELKDVINQVSSSYGDVKVFDVESPLKIAGDYREICFIELEKEKTGDVIGKNLIMNSWNDNVKVNVFLVKDDMEYSFYADNISIDPDNSICIPITNGKINNMKLEGIGGSAKVFIP